ncbi:MAG: hypothetical protein HYS12_02070 [Planctomycetes bacterium]|nr:hypothetical protein [Planctomycetota bacterium]
MKSVTCSLLALGSLLVVGLGGQQLSSLLHAQEANKGLVWKHGLNFHVRKAGQTKFDEGMLKFGTEIFHDKDIDKLVYIAETGALGLGVADKVKDKPEVDPPKLFHGLELRVRPVNEKGWTKAVKFGAEVFKDVNVDNLVYLSEKGSIGILPAGSLSAAEKIKDPEWSHGLDVKVRKAGEKEFSEKTKKVSLEVYRDENTKQLIYITDGGVIAVVDARDSTKPAEVKGPTWWHAFEVKVRKADEKDFTKDTKAYGVEVYMDENNNNLLYITETGAIAVVPASANTKPAGSKEPKWLFGRSFRVRKADEKDFNDRTQKHGAEIYKDENTTNNLVYLTDSGWICVFQGK